MNFLNYLQKHSTRSSDSGFKPDTEKVTLRMGKSYYGANKAWNFVPVLFDEEGEVEHETVTLARMEELLKANGGHKGEKMETYFLTNAVEIARSKRYTGYADLYQPDENGVSRWVYSATDRPPDFTETNTAFQVFMSSITPEMNYLDIPVAEGFPIDDVNEMFRILTGQTPVYVVFNNLKDPSFDPDDEDTWRPDNHKVKIDNETGDRKVYPARHSYISRMYMDEAGLLEYVEANGIPLLDGSNDSNPDTNGIEPFDGWNEGTDLGDSDWESTSSEFQNVFQEFLGNDVYDDLSKPKQLSVRSKTTKALVSAWGEFVPEDKIKAILEHVIASL